MLAGGQFRWCAMAAGEAYGLQCRGCLGSTLTVTEEARQIGVIEQTPYRWRQEDGRLKVGRTRWRRDVVRQNVRFGGEHE